MQPCDRLTAKEIQVATLVWKGQTNREIAAVIGTTEQVIKNYLRNTFDKLGVWSRLELALYVAAHGGMQWRELAPSPAPVSAAEIHPLQQVVLEMGALTDENDQKSAQSRNKSGGSPRLVSA
jgi:DNA-binding CsgD family transcriptional regulator